MYRKYFKRAFDIVCSFLALIVLSPVLLITALLVRIKLGAPVIFKQKRPGLNERLFTIYKFRTMNSSKNTEGVLLPDLKRLTSFGRFLRKLSIDELPEFYNVLKGDMSIVGPRPLLEKYLPLYNEIQRQRHSMRPGITGLAQVSGRNETTWEQRFELDIYYIKNASIILDFSIIAKTLLMVFRKKGIDSNSSKKFTMDEFTG
jgi:lipopolysaccharide/colanic/teichoic acid biosynthesis glycosyltransferase